MKFLHYTFLSMLTVTAALSGCGNDKGFDPNEEKEETRQAFAGLDRRFDQIDEEFDFTMKMAHLHMSDNTCFTFLSPKDFEALTASPNPEQFLEILSHYPEIIAYVRKNGFTQEDMFLLADTSVTKHKVELGTDPNLPDFPIGSVELFCYARDKGLAIAASKLPKFSLKAPKYILEIRNAQ